MTLHIIYEDDALIFVDKPAGMVVQRGYDPDEEVLFELVTRHLQAKGERAFLMQRLDRGTSGIIFFTKNSRLNAKITRQFEQKQIRKTYLALCEGRLADHQLIDAPLQRIGPISFGVKRSGKKAITEVSPVTAVEQTSLLRVELHTGRTHQIRVHLAAIGYPLVGDWLYGQRNAARPMLHAYSLEMRHPVARNQLRLSSPAAGDFTAEAARRGIGDLGRYLAETAPDNAQSA